MVNYSTLKVNEQIKPMLRAIGRPFPSTKQEMVALLQKYDEEHPDAPASSLPIPTKQPRKKRATTAPVPASNAQGDVDARQRSRKRKEPPALQSAPQTKRLNSDGKSTTLSDSARTGQDGDSLMFDAHEDAAPESDAAGPSRNTRLSEVENNDEEHGASSAGSVQRKHGHRLGELDSREETPSFLQQKPTVGAVEEAVLTEKQKRKEELHKARPLGGYADPDVSSSWRQKKKTVLASEDDHIPAGKSRAPIGKLGYRRRLERDREEAKTTGIAIPRQDCKSPPRRLNDGDLIDYVHYDSD